MGDEYTFVDFVLQVEGFLRVLVVHLVNTGVEKVGCFVEQVLGDEDSQVTDVVSCHRSRVMLE